MNKREELERRLKNIESLITESKDLAKSYKQEKKQLKKQLNDLPSLEVGKWYKHNTSNLLIFIEDITENLFKRYGFDKLGDWHTVNNYLGIKNELRPATDKEVETALIAEAKKRGFKEGVLVDNSNLGYYGNSTSSVLCDREDYIGFGYSMKTLDFGGKIIFKKGKWAEIIKPKTLHIPSGDYTETQLKDILNNKFNK